MGRIEENYYTETLKSSYDAPPEICEGIEAWAWHEKKLMSENVDNRQGVDKRSMFTYYNDQVQKIEGVSMVETIEAYGKPSWAFLLWINLSQGNDGAERMGLKNWFYFRTLTSLLAPFFFPQSRP